MPTQIPPGTWDTWGLRSQGAWALPSGPPIPQCSGLAVSVAGEGSGALGTFRGLLCSAGCGAVRVPP